MNEQVFVFDGSKVYNLEHAHRVLASLLDFPSYYGHNLDAMFDLLSTYNGMVKIVLVVIFPVDFIFNVGDDARRFLSVLRQAAAYSPSYELRMIINEYELSVDD